MVLPPEIAKIFFECMDKSAIVNFRRFLARHPMVKKGWWLRTFLSRKAGRWAASRSPLYLATPGRGISNAT